jgi:hypothetical protein
MAHDKGERRLAVRQARILERRPLIKTSDNQHDSAKDIPGAVSLVIRVAVRVTELL